MFLNQWQGYLPYKCRLARGRPSQVESQAQTWVRAWASVYPGVMPNNKKPAKKKSSTRKNTGKQTKAVGVREGRLLWKIPFTDQNSVGTPVSTSTTTLSLFTEMASATGLFQAFPQHASPFFEGGSIGFRLRQAIRIRTIEADLVYVGAQSNVLALGDLYNTVRLAVYESGETYQSSSLTYASSVVTSDVRDVTKVFHDEMVPLPTQAFDSVNSYNVPQVLTKRYQIPINQTYVFFSQNPTGAGVAWETTAKDILLEIVSDSSAPPHPTVIYNFRVWFEYVKSR